MDVVSIPRSGLGLFRRHARRDSVTLAAKSFQSLVRV